MRLGRVIGTVVATTKAEGLEGVRLLIVQPLGPDLAERDRPVVAADGVAMAGRGELVTYVESREAALALDPWFVPVDHAVTGIVDRVDREPPE